MPVATRWSSSIRIKEESRMMNTIRTIMCVTAGVLAISTIPPAFSQSTPKQQQAQESTGEANSQHQLGGQKRDHKINREIFRHSQNRMGYRYRHAQ
jgi:hypothetical protein